MIQFKKVINKIFFISTIFYSIHLSATIDYLDTAFGSDATGIITGTIGTSSQVNGLAIDSNGKIIAAGHTTITEVQNLAIARYTSAGALDTTFNTTGIVTALPSGTTQVGINAVTVDSNNKVVVAGFAVVSGASNIFVARYTTAGAPDNTFGTGGFFYNLVGDGDSASSVLVDANGKIVVSGSAVISGQNNVFVTRLNSDGTLDSGFNSGNVFTITGSSHYVGTSLKLDLNAKVVVAGSASTLSGTDFLVIRLNTNGTLDTTFNSGGSTPGVQVTNILSNANNNVHSIVVDSSNRVIASGSTAASSNNSFALVRYASDGTVDTTFGTNGDGIVTTAIGADAIPYASLIDQSGNIVLTGYSDENFTTARYSANGSLDTAFGVSGIVNSAININAQGYASVLQSSDGRVVAGGFNLTNENSGNGRFVLLRYNKNNTDFVNLTTISDNSTITTKIPTLSGTSNGTTSPQATVQVVVNGVTFTTVNTDNSGNWNAGQLSGSFVLPIGSNTIRINLIISASTVVSHVTKFTVVDTFSEDSVFAYNTTSQTKSTNSSGFTALPFDNTPILGTWTYASNVFTCNKTGRYHFSYMAHPGVSILGALGVVNVSTMISFATPPAGAVEYPGSGANSNVDGVINLTRACSKAVIKDLTAGDTVRLNYAVTLAAGGASTAGLLLNPNTQGSQYPYSMAITRIG